MLEQLISKLTELALLIAITAIPVIAAYIKEYLSCLSERVRAETRCIQQKEELELYTAALAEVNRLTATTVTALEQTDGKDIKEKAKAGSIMTYSLSALRCVAVERILNNLSPNYETVLKIHITDLKSYIEDCVEVQVYKLKNNLK